MLFIYLLHETVDHCRNEDKYLIVNLGSFRPQLGELVCIEMNDEWCRGYVTSLSPQLHLAMVDEARIVPVTKPEAIIAYPKELLDISYYGVTCEVTNGKLQVNVFKFFPTI